MNLSSLDKIGKTVHKILVGDIDEKFDALVSFNDYLTASLQDYKQSLYENSEFISRTFADVLDGIFQFIDSVPPKFIKYFIIVFKKWFCLDFVTKQIGEEELTILVEIVQLRLQPSSIASITDYTISQEISKDLNIIMHKIIEYSDPSFCFYTLLELSTKYDYFNDSFSLLLFTKIKLIKKVQKDMDSLNVERILLMLHRYLIQYSQNLLILNSGRL